MQVNIGRFRKRHVHGFFICMSVCFLSYMAGKQYFGVSKDVEEYAVFFRAVDSSYLGRFEPLFVWLTIFIKSVVNDFQAYLFFLTLFSLALKVYILRKFNYFWFSCFLYLLILFPLHELTQYRTSLSLGLVYMAFYLLSSGGSKIKIWFLALSAGLVHYSALAFLPIIAAWGFLGESKKLRWYFLVFGIAVLIAAKQIIFQYAASINSTLEAPGDYYANIFSSRNVVFFFIVVLGFFQLKKIPDMVKPFWYLSLYGFVLWGVFIDLPIFAHRLLEMTFFSYLIWVSFLTGIYLRASQFMLLLLSIYLIYKGLYIEPLLY